MKINKVIFIIVFLLCTVFVAGCTSNSKTYSSNGTSFDYPESWNVSNDPYGDIIIENPNNTDTFCRVIDDALGGSDLLIETFKSGKNFNIISEKNISVNGKNATELIFTGNVGNDADFSNVTELSLAMENLRNSWLTKNNSGNHKELKYRVIIIENTSSSYLIICAALPQNFEEENANFDLIINSFKFE